MHGLGDVLQYLIAEVFDREIEFSPRLGHDRALDADAAGLGHRFEPGGDVDPVAEDVVAVDDDVAEIDPDAPFDAGLGRLGAFRHRRLPLGRAAHRVDDAGELDEQPVAGGLDDAAVMLGDGRVDQLRAQRLEPRERALLVGAHQPGVAGDIGGEDRGELALNGRRNRPWGSLSCGSIAGRAGLVTDGGEIVQNALVAPGRHAGAASSGERPS